MIIWNKIDATTSFEAQKNYLFMQQPFILIGRPIPEFNNLGNPIWNDHEGNCFTEVTHYAELNFPQIVHDTERYYFVSLKMCQDGVFYWEGNIVLDIHPVDWTREFNRVCEKLQNGKSCYVFFFEEISKDQHDLWKSEFEED